MMADETSSPRKIHVTVEVTIELKVGDQEYLDRAQTEEWKRSLYDLDDEEEVLGHLAYNFVANGVRDAVRLDGWADLERDQLTMTNVPYTFHVNEVRDA